ncbi:hypothetical protein M3Y94_01070200 [Aphelenchoides besseyi]|nr:hypothetical protein M3Y94_01070200 [Aphelenchoides besseyi]KAI6216384.1 hypothetical protein M3Y95_01278100 [Aphelenchoides besseyi]
MLASTGMKSITNGGRCIESNKMHQSCEYLLAYSQDGRFVYSVRPSYSLITVFDSWLDRKMWFMKSGFQYNDLCPKPIIFALATNRVAVVYNTTSHHIAICVYLLNFVDETFTSEVTVSDFKVPDLDDGSKMWRTQREDQFLFSIATYRDGVSFYSYNSTEKKITYLHKLNNTCTMCEFHFNVAKEQIYVCCRRRFSHSKIYAVRFNDTDASHKQFEEFPMIEEFGGEWSTKHYLLRWSHTYEGSNLYALAEAVNDIFDPQPAKPPQLHIFNMDLGTTECYALTSFNQSLNGIVMNVFEGYLTIHSNVNERVLPWTTGIYALNKPETLLNLAFFNCSPLVKLDPKYASLMRPFIFINRPTTTTKRKLTENVFDCADETASPSQKRK